MFSFEFSDEIKDTSAFKHLAQICRQELIPSVKNQIEIMNEFVQVTELSEALNTLKILINYALTTAASGELGLAMFLSRIYTNPDMQKNAETVLKPKVGSIILNPIFGFIN